MASSGCAVTSAAMVAYYYGSGKDPGQLHDALSAIGALPNGMITWTSVRQAAGGTTSDDTYLDYSSQPTDLNRINAELDAGYPVIVSIQKWHWVVLTGHDGGTYYMNDPLSGAKNANFNGTYGDPVQIIYYVHIYHGQHQPPLPPVFNYWKGEYYSNQNLSGSPVAYRDDGAATNPIIDLSWGLNAPISGLPADHFSVRWTRTLDFAAGPYRFHELTDDGARLYVDGQLVINDWIVEGYIDHTGDITLSAGNHQVVLEYFDNAYDAAATLYWEALPKPPTITSISPKSGSTAGGTSVTITGTGFDWGLTELTFGGTSALNSVVSQSDTQITVIAPAHSAGTVQVQVTTLKGPTGDTAADDFTYVAPVPAPTITSLSPATGTTAGGTYVTITGTNLPGATKVTFGSSVGTGLVVNSATKITVTTPSRAAGKVDVQVTTPGGASVITGTGDDFTYVAPPAYTRYDQTDIHIVKSGTWSNYAAISAYNGSYGRSSTALASATIYFTGTRLDWITTKGTTAGKADVYLDGVKVTATPIDLAASAVTYQVNVWSTGTLPNGAHTVKIERSATSAGGKYLTLDAVDIYGTIADPPVVKTRYEQTNILITKTGTWSTYTSTPSSGGSYGRSSTASASATIKFVGTRLDYIAMKGTTTGYAEIWVDGVKVTSTSPINLYASPAAYQQNVYSTGTLAFGLHTVKIVRASASASGKYLTLDAFDVWGWIAG